MLLAQHPEREPTTRELYDAAGVGAPTLYHHFGDKRGLIEAVFDEAFTRYLAQKHDLPQTGDSVADFGAGWDMHIRFGVQNPALYTILYGRAERRRSHAAQAAETELRRAITRLADAGVLQMDVDEAIAVTTAMAIGCVTHLIQHGESNSGPLARTMRSALLFQLTGVSPERDNACEAVRAVLAMLSSAAGLFTGPEDALLRQWLRMLAEHSEQVSAAVGVATPTPQ